MSNPRNIVTTDTDPNRPDILNTHTLSVYVNNQPGVLARIAQVFSRRAYNIDSLVVSHGRDPQFSRMTIGVSGDPQNLDLIIESVNKLIDVIHCFEHTAVDAVVRELALVKVTADPSQRAEIIQILEHYEGKTVDVSDSSLVVMVTGTSDELDSVIKLLTTYDIAETVRTGKVVMARGDQAT